MPKTKGDIQPKKRGRKTGEEVLRQVAFALKNVDKVDRLEDSPLARLSAVRQLAAQKYPESLYPAGFAVRRMLSEAVRAVINDLDALAAYNRELQFLCGYVQGQSVAAISRRLGLSREHVARTVQPRAFSLVTRAFLVKADGNRGKGAQTSADENNG